MTSRIRISVFGAFGIGIYDVFEFESSFLAEDLVESDFGGSAKVGLPLSRGV